MKGLFTCHNLSFIRTTTVILQCHFNNDVFFIGISRSFYRQVQRVDDLFACRCADCNIPTIHDESQLIDPDSENICLPIELSPRRDLRDRLDGFEPIWNNDPRECLFMVFYLTFFFCCYLGYHKVRFLVLWFSQ